METKNTRKHGFFIIEKTEKEKEIYKERSGSCS